MGFEYYKKMYVWLFLSKFWYKYFKNIIYKIIICILLFEIRYLMVILNG